MSFVLRMGRYLFPAGLLVSALSTNAFGAAFTVSVSSSFAVGEHEVLVKESFGQGSNARGSVADVLVDGELRLSAEAWFETEPLTQNWKLCVVNIEEHVCVKVEQVYPTVVASHIITAKAQVERTTKGNTTVLLGDTAILVGSLQTRYVWDAKLDETVFEIPSELASAVVGAIGEETLIEAAELLAWFEQAKKLQRVTDYREDRPTEELRISLAPLQMTGSIVELSQGVLNRVLTLAGVGRPDRHWGAEELAFEMSEPDVTSLSGEALVPKDLGLTEE